MPNEADLSGECDILSQFGTARYAGLGDDNRVAPDDDVVGDLDEVVDFGAFLNPCAAKAGAVDGDVCSDLDVVIDLDAAGLGNLDMPAGGEFVAEPVAADDGAGMDDDAGTDEGALANGDVRVKVALLAKGGLLAYEDMGADDGAGANDGAALDDGEGLDGDRLAEGDIGADDGGGMDARRIGDGGGGEFLKGLREGERWVRDLDKGGGDILLCEVERDEGGGSLGLLERREVAGVAEEGDLGAGGLGDGGGAGDREVRVAVLKDAAGEGGEFCEGDVHDGGAKRGRGKEKARRGLSGALFR